MALPSTSGGVEESNGSVGVNCVLGDVLTKPLTIVMRGALPKDIAGAPLGLVGVGVLFSSPSFSSLSTARLLVAGGSKDELSRALPFKGMVVSRLLVSRLLVARFCSSIDTFRWNTT